MIAGYLRYSCWCSPEGFLSQFPIICHACAPKSGVPFFYRGLNLTREVMLDLAEEVTGAHTLPGLSRCLVRDTELACRLRPLH